MQRHAVAEQGIGVDQHLKLFVLAAHHKNLRDARYRQQPSADHPVGERSQRHWRSFACLTPHADDHDLTHDRRDRRQLHRNPGRKSIRDEGDPFVDDLAVVVDIGSVIEFDVQDRHADPRRTPDGLDSGRSVECGLEGKRDQRFHLFRGHSRRLDHERHPWSIQIGKYVNRQF